MAALDLNVEDFYNRLYDTVITTGKLDVVPDWIKKRTTLKGQPWSYVDHEYQIDIAKDTSNDLCGMKCSQIGFSELTIRIVLAYLAIRAGYTAIYVLPTRTFAQKFSKGRIDPVVEGSESLTKLLIAGSDGSEMKRFGMSTLYIGGATNDSQAISIPADILVRDEYDFCNPVVLGKYESRLRHALNGGIKRDFSTPTVPGYGVDSLYSESTRGRYFVKCLHCGHNHAPDFDTQVIIPGYTGPFEEFDLFALDDERFSVGEAYLACELCRNDLKESLLNPKRREWVHQYPTLSKKGFSIRPFDVPAYNTVPSIIEQLRNYKTRQDYVNFVHGLPYRSKFSEMNLECVKRGMVLEEVHASKDEIIVGIDVGKVVYVSIGKRFGKELLVLKVISLSEKFGGLGAQIIDLLSPYNICQLVIDAGPDFSLAKSMVDHYGEIAHPCVYVATNIRKPEIFRLEGDNNMVLAQRTKAFDALVALNNGSGIKYCKSEEMNIAMRHYHGMKRVDQAVEDGEKEPKWVKLPKNPDHYFHSLLYLYAASELYEALGSGTASYEVPIAVMGATIPEKDYSLDRVSDIIRIYSGS